VLDGAAPFYRTYRCKDGKHVAVGPIEPTFYRLLLELLGIDDPVFSDQHDRAIGIASASPATDLRDASREEWVAVFAGTDACVAPVNSLSESLADRPFAGARIVRGYRRREQPALPTVSGHTLNRASEPARWQCPGAS
jgi:crotonobetainyl-CoA:carnitine CoA-transferase CaiB-like acyl-CoA transferase